MVLCSNYTRRHSQHHDDLSDYTLVLAPSKVNYHSAGTSLQEKGKSILRSDGPRGSHVGFRVLFGPLSCG